MAEAIVEDRPQPQQRFYCHLCSVEIQLITPDFTCPLCSGGFIEELPAPSEASSDDVEMTEANGIDDLDMIRDELATLLMSRGARPPEADGDDDQQGGAGNRGNRRNRRRHRIQTFDRFDNILLDILQTLSGGNDAAVGNASMFFMGNPGDYAWGHGGIDTIVTQLLNQMDTTGPPPLPKDKIDEIPNVEITQDQVDLKLQCSVCWEDFKLDEFVRKLPCSHVYHENCIVPWLELHGTCPICRKSLTPESADSLQNLTTYIRDSSNEPSDSNRSNSNGITLFNPASSSSHTESQLTGQDSVFSAPFQLSRIFSQPGTSQQQPQQQVQQSNSASNAENRSRNDGGGGGGGGGGNARNGNRTATGQNDVYKYDDGNVDYEFD